MKVLSCLLALFCATASAVPSAPHMHDASSLAKTDPKVKQTPSFTNKELYNMTKNFFDQFIYPANVKQTASINSTLFSEDVLGRVDVTRTFVGRGR